MKTKEIMKAINRLGPWYQRYNMEGHWTTDNMLTGQHIWPDIRGLMEDDISETRILDIGANAAYYSTMLALEGANVIAVEPKSLYFKQAKWTKYYFEKLHKRKIPLKLVQKKASELDFQSLGWFDYILAISVIYFMGKPGKEKYSKESLNEQKRIVSEICKYTDKVVVRTRNKLEYSSVGYYTSLFLENDFYLLRKVTAKRPIMLYGRLIKDGDYGWEEQNF